MDREWRRYVAIGDSSTEGLDDPDGAGGYRGWADRFARHLATAQDRVEYANLAVRGCTTARIRAEQLEPALALRPDLMTVATGVNDLLRPGFDVGEVAGHLEQMLGACTAVGVTTVAFTWPDPAGVHPAAHLLTRRVDRLNDVVREVAARTGARVLDLADHPVASDPRLWSDDRLHANTLGHERIAAALAHLLELPGHDERWASPLSPPAPPVVSAAQRLREDAVWLRRHGAPWALRRLRRRSSGDELGPKRPDPRPLAAAEWPGAGRAAMMETDQGGATVAQHHLVAVDGPEHLGRPRWRGQPERLEVWYATFTDPARGDGYWLHHEVVADLAGAAHGLGWLAVFPADGQPLLERFGPEPVTAQHLDETRWFEAAGAHVGPGRMAGHSARASWDLAFEDDAEPLFTFPEYAWHGSILPSSQVVPWPTATLSGSVSLGDHKVHLREARGAVSRIYGRGNAHRWGWLHADLGNGDALEIVAAQGRAPALRRVPPKVFCRLRVDGEDWPRDPLAAAAGSRARLELPRWYASVTTPGRRLRTGVRIPPSSSVTLEYRDPDDAASRCTNSCRADIEVRLERRTLRGWEVERSWSLRGTGHAEIGQRP